MHAVIFEVWPKEEGRQEYLDIAAALRPQLEKMDGFISIERFESLSRKGNILETSLSFSATDAAIFPPGARSNATCMAQAKGRGELFRDYRLRIAAIVRDYGMNERTEAPEDSRTRHG